MKSEHGYYYKFTSYHKYKVSFFIIRIKDGFLVFERLGLRNIITLVRIILGDIYFSKLPHKHNRTLNYLGNQKSEDCLRDGNLNVVEDFHDWKLRFAPGSLYCFTIRYR